MDEDGTISNHEWVVLEQVRRVRRWKIKLLLVNLTKDRLVSGIDNGGIRACYQQEVEIDHVTQTKCIEWYYPFITMSKPHLTIHYYVKSSLAILTAKVKQVLRHRL